MLALPGDGIVCCVLPILPIGRPISLFSLAFFFFFFFFFLFVQPILKVQTNNYNLLNCHNMEHNSAGGWRLCGVVWTFRCRFPAG